MTVDSLVTAYMGAPDNSRLIRRTSAEIIKAARKRANHASLTVFLEHLQHITRLDRPGYPRLVDQPAGVLEPAPPLYELTEIQRDLMAAILGTFHHLVGVAPLRDDPEKDRSGENCPIGG